MKLTRPQELALVEALDNDNILELDIGDTESLLAEEYDGVPQLTYAGVLTATIIRERDQAREVLRETLDFAEECHPYVDEFFREKWELEQPVLEALQAKVKAALGDD